MKPIDRTEYLGHRKQGGIVLSGNASRKHKQFRLMQERRELFGNLSAKDECGKVDLTAFSAARGNIITGSICNDPSRVPVKKTETERRHPYRRVLLYYPEGE